jgi:hypothetical protein
VALSPETHGVIVTHGIGDNMKPGDTLADFANCLADYLMESPAIDAQGNKVYPEIRREVDLTVQPSISCPAYQIPGRGRNNLALQRSLLG